MTTLRSILLALGFSLLSAAFTGCTALGLAWGVHADQVNSVRVQTTSQHPVVVPKGSRVCVVLMNGDTLSGIFRGLEELPMANYAAMYNSARASIDPACAIPSLGTLMSVTTISGETIRQRFAGFGSQSLILQSSLVTDWERPHRKEVLLWNIREMSNRSGTAYSVDRLTALSTERQLPLRQALLVQTSGSIERIPLQSVNSISTIPRRTYYALGGILIGAVADVLVITVVDIALGGGRHRSGNESFLSFP